MKIAILFLTIILFAGCSNHPRLVDLKISLTDSNRSLKIAGFDKLIIADIGRDTNNEAWESLLPVYKMPSDTDMKDYQNVQPGKYAVKDSLVIFTPDTAFKRGQAYFLRHFRHGEGTSAWKYIREKKRPGSISYKDLVFSY
ncbi:hypothetical protein [Mucilaginibacter sp. BT774]|uniref:hypothetical protein n=1 Tax=Mucilaginibacter sp. BT774 TaxID=3062276 RepID=UPI00267482D6|nr:hypothetical protein [Mucilaginibacter sp. BT774]MDO3626650.1 hypothetical protein [Mucilaginibacter sp. BT774]